MAGAVSGAFNSHALASFQSSRTVSSDTLRTSAVSLTLSPAAKEQFYDLAFTAVDPGETRERLVNGDEIGAGVGRDDGGHIQCGPLHAAAALQVMCGAK